MRLKASSSVESREIYMYKLKVHLHIFKMVEYDARLLIFLFNHLVLFYRKLFSKLPFLRAIEEKKIPTL